MATTYSPTADYNSVTLCSCSLIIFIDFIFYQNKGNHVICGSEIVCVL